jgi:condensin complex subunit 2
VDVETKKLLNGLQSYGKFSILQKGQNDDVELDKDGEDVGVVKQKKSHRHTNTLEKDISNLDLKKLDIEFTVDPLFRKTSADFDEGGARGLLLNHLSISSNGQIIFDAGDMSVDALNESLVPPGAIDYDKLKGNWIYLKIRKL